MEFWRAEMLMENLQKYNDKEKEHRQKEEESQKSDMGDYSPSSMMSGANSMMKNAQASMPSMSMPNMGSFKL